MNIIIFGSTGKTGLQLISQLVETDNQITAFARTPAKLDAFKGKIRIIAGDARDPASVDKAVSGQDAVMHALSESLTEKTDIQTVFAENLVKAMQKNHVKRLIVLSARGAGESRKQVPFLIELLLRTALKNLFIDKKNAEEKIAASSLDYTFIRPLVLANGDPNGKFILTDKPKGLKWRIKRADVAASMIAQLNDNTWICRAPFIGYPTRQSR